MASEIKLGIRVGVRSMALLKMAALLHLFSDWLLVKAIKFELVK